MPRKSAVKDRHPHPISKPPRKRAKAKPAVLKKTKIVGLHEEWEATRAKVKRLRSDLNKQYRRTKLSVPHLLMIMRVWMTTTDERYNIVQAMRDYPDAVPYDELVSSVAFDQVVDEIIRCRTHWPACAIPALKKYLNRRYAENEKSDERGLFRHLLHEIWRHEKAGFLREYRSWILKFGYVSQCGQLIEDEESRKTLDDRDYDKLIKRFAKYNGHNTHPLITLATAKGFPGIDLIKIVRILIEDKRFHDACDLVEKCKRDDLVVMLEDRAVNLELHHIRDFLRKFPKANKERFRDVVRKLLTPDPEDIIDQFLNGRDRHHGHGHPFDYGPPWRMESWMCEHHGHGRRR